MLWQLLLRAPLRADSEARSGFRNRSRHGGIRTDGEVRSGFVGVGFCRNSVGAIAEMGIKQPNSIQDTIADAAKCQSSIFA